MRTATEDSMGMRHEVAGFALPAAVIGVVVVGVLVTGGIQVATQEFRMGAAAERATEAFYVAESGMNNVIANWRPANSPVTLWSAPEEWNGVSGQGTWTAEIRQVDSQTYFIVATGSVPAGNGNMAQRSVGVLTRMLTAQLAPPAALMTMGQVRVTGAAQIRGNDTIPPGWDTNLCPDPLQNLPGVVADPDATLQLSGGGSVSGTPSGFETSEDVTEESFTKFGDMEWADLVSMASISILGSAAGDPGPSFVGGACNYNDITNWGDPANPYGACGNYFPIVYVDGDVSFQGGGSGQGILLIDGNLDLRGGFRYDGIIIVQGAFGVQGGGANGPRINGGVFSRNADLDRQSFVGSSIVQNSRCAINRSIQNNSTLTRLAPIAQRSWVDVTGTTF